MRETYASTSFLVLVEGSNFFKSSYYRYNMWFQLIRLPYSAQKQSQESVLKKRVLINFAKFTEKHLCWGLFIKKRLQHRHFPVNFASDVF